MSFWELLSSSFSNNTSNSQEKVSQLHQKIVQLFPDKEDEEVVELTCLAGLLARVAYVDFDLHENEQKKIEEALIQRCHLPKEEAKRVSSLATEEIKELSGLENHLYCHPLTKQASDQKRYSILECLFQLAASDGEVSNLESEEIRQISTSLLLEHKHFIAARAKVLDTLASLKKD